MISLGAYAHVRILLLCVCVCNPVPAQAQARPDIFSKGFHAIIRYSHTLHAAKDLDVDKK